MCCASEGVVPAAEMDDDLDMTSVMIMPRFTSSNWWKWSNHARVAYGIGICKC